MRTNRWASVIAGMSVLYLVGCSTDRPTGVANEDNGPPKLFSVGAAAIRFAAGAVNERDKEFLTIPKMEAAMQRHGIKTNLVNSPFDMNFNGGPVVTHSAERAVYINCPSAPACWSTGNLSPSGFLKDLDHSNIIQVANQYIHGDAFNRFRQVTENQILNYPFAFDTADNTPTATGGDILRILAGALVANGLQAGYTNEYHLFFPPGVNVCLGPHFTDCYSPNNGATFNFCAFHSSVDFITQNNDTLHTLFSVEPFQFVPGCVIFGQNRVIDGTASTLSHEFMETITDPDGDAWFSQTAGIAGLEIGDLCFAFRNPEQVGNHVYTIQEEYSNQIHACTDNAN